MKKFLLFLFLISICVSSEAAYKNYTIYLYTYPNAIIADDISTCDISAEVYDEDGNKVSDGIEVDFSTTLGNITPFDYTSGGIASATLRSVPTEGTAIVTATIPSYGVMARTTIDFLAPGTEIIKDGYFSIESDVYLGYDSNTRIIDTFGGFSATYKGVTYEGYEAQIDSLKGIAKMRSQLGEFFTIKKQDKVIEATSLYLNLSTNKGYAIIVDPEKKDSLDPLKLVSIRFSDLNYEDCEDLPKEIDFDITPIEDSNIYVTAHLFILDPKKEIKVKNAKVYVAEKHLVDLPWLRINVRDENGVFGSPISVGTNGLNINMPMYLYLTKHGSSGVRVQRNQSSNGTFSSGNDMWRLDMENEYGTGTDSSGTFNITTFNKQAGARLNNTTKFANKLTFRGSLDYPNHQNFYSNLEINQNLKNIYYSIKGRTYNYKTTDNRYYVSGYIQTQSKPFLKVLNYNVSNQLYFDTSYTNKNSRLANKTGLDVYTNTFTIGDWSLNANGAYYHKFQNLYNGNSYSFNINSNLRLGTWGNWGVHYSFLNEKFEETYKNKYISTDLNIGNNFFSLGGSGTYNFDAKNYSLYGEIGIYPWPTWSLKFYSTYQYYYQEDKYTDYKISLGKQIGFTQVRIVYNKSRNRVDLEVGNVSF